jgi:phosphoribosyl-dephospho-CoA transferase
MRVHRHDLLRADSAVWDAMLRNRPDLVELPLVADWARCERPVMVRRRMASDSAGAVPAGLPLPPTYGKRRLAFGLASGTGVVVLPPVLLREAAQAAPLAWNSIIGALIELGDVIGTKPRVFGALLWQYATGLAYLREGSDLDLLWSVSDEDTATALVKGLDRLDRTGPIRLDGELILPDGAAVNWRELEQESADLLIKTMDGVEIRTRSALFRTGGPPS